MPYSSISPTPIPSTLALALLVVLATPSLNALLTLLYSLLSLLASLSLSTSYLVVSIIVVVMPYLLALYNELAIAIATLDLVDLTFSIFLIDLIV